MLIYLDVWWDIFRDELRKLGVIFFTSLIFELVKRRAESTFFCENTTWLSFRNFKFFWYSHLCMFLLEPQKHNIFIQVLIYVIFWQKIVNCDIRNHHTFFQIRNLFTHDKTAQLQHLSLKMGWNDNDFTSFFGVQKWTFYKYRLY